MDCRKASYAAMASMQDLAINHANSSKAKHECETHKNDNSCRDKEILNMQRTGLRKNVREAMYEMAVCTDDR